MTFLKMEPAGGGSGARAAGRRWALAREEARSSARVGFGADILLIGILIEKGNSILPVCAFKIPGCSIKNK